MSGLEENKCLDLDKTSVFERNVIVTQTNSHNLQGEHDRVYLVPNLLAHDLGSVQYKQLIDDCSHLPLIPLLLVLEVSLPVCFLY